MNNRRILNQNLIKLLLIFFSCFYPLQYETSVHTIAYNTKSYNLLWNSSSKLKRKFWITDHFCMLYTEHSDGGNPWWQHWFRKAWYKQCWKELDSSLKMSELLWFSYFIIYFFNQRTLRIHRRGILKDRYYQQVWNSEINGQRVDKQLPKRKGTDVQWVGMWKQ